jgi:quercetin dioxygenase-like cupin family protein
MQHDSSVTKVQQGSAPRGEMGQTYLATGVSIGMRLWDAVPPGQPKPAAARDYETVGYVIAGRAALHLEGQVLRLEPGDSWVVPRGSEHTYEIQETFTAVEATHPPAHVHARDEREV